jgi:hypothetical protein
MLIGVRSDKDSWANWGGCGREVRQGISFSHASTPSGEVLYFYPFDEKRKEKEK